MQADDHIRPNLFGRSDHPLVSFLPGLFAHLREGLDVAADQLFGAAEKSLLDARGPDHDPAYNAQVLGDPVARDLIPRCHNHAPVLPRRTIRPADTAAGLTSLFAARHRALTSVDRVQGYCLMPFVKCSV